MSDDNTQPAAPVDDLQALNESIAKLEAKNRELIGELRNKKEPSAEVLAELEELRELKRRQDQSEAESKGQYDKALQAHDQQFRDREAQLTARVQELEARLQHTQLDARVLSVLADRVHDPEAALQLMRANLQLNDRGDVVAKDGYDELALDAYLDRQQQARPWLFRQPKMQGSGAPAGRTAAVQPSGGRNPFTREHFNLTEQMRIKKADPALYDRLRAEAQR
jgi:hypothetical protein